MKVRILIGPAAAALLSVGGFAFAQQPASEPQAQQTPAPQPAAQPKAATQPAATPSAEASDNAEATATNAKPHPIAVFEKTEADAKKAAATAPARTPEQAAIAMEIAKKAPKRVWRTAALTPAQKATVMYPLDAKRISDVAIIASVDRVNKLELLDITGDGASDTLRMPTSGPKFVNETTAAGEPSAASAPEATATSASPSAATPSADATAPKTEPQ